jgi:hypothetical protein
MRVQAGFMLRRIARMGIPFVFTNQHAYPATADYFSDLADLHRIDWTLLQSRDFKHDPDDPGKKERYQAERLIRQHVPLALRATVDWLIERTSALAFAGLKNDSTIVQNLNRYEARYSREYNRAERLQKENSSKQTTSEEYLYPAVPPAISSTALLLDNVGGASRPRI